MQESTNMNKSILMPVLMLLQLKISAHGNLFMADSLNREAKQSSVQRDMQGIEFVDITGVVNMVNGKFVLQSKDQKSYRLNCAAGQCHKYVGQSVKAHGILMQGYDNPKYGNQNLPISQIAPGDIINVITSVSIEPCIVK